MFHFPGALPALNELHDANFGGNHRQFANYWNTYVSAEPPATTFSNMNMFNEPFNPFPTLSSSSSSSSTSSTDYSSFSPPPSYDTDATPLAFSEGLGETIQKIIEDVNSKEDGSEKSYGIFKEFNMDKEKKTKLAEFLAGNMDTLMRLSTKVDISIHDFRNSTLGAKIRQKLEILKTLKKAAELELIDEEQFEQKQQQFLDSFDFAPKAKHQRCF